MAEYEGNLIATGMRFGIIAARFNEQISRPLLEGARSCLLRHGCDEASIVVAWVPGAFELGVTAKRLAASGDVDAVICLGAVIRGETAHFEHVAGQAAAAVARASLDTGVPVVFGVLTTETADQALARAGGKLGNKGFEAALGAIEMVDLLRQLPKAQGEAGSRREETA